MRRIIWNPSQFGTEEIEPKIEEVFQKYKYALDCIGIDFESPSIQEAILKCDLGLEEAFQATINYWNFKLGKNEDFEHPNAFLVKAITERWRPYLWKEEWLLQFQTFSQYWWKKAGKVLGIELRDRLLREVKENQYGEPYILLASGSRLYFDALEGWTWERFIDYIFKLIQENGNQQLQAKLLESKSKIRVLQTLVAE